MVKPHPLDKTLTKKFLIKEYIVNERSTINIANELGTYYQLISRRMKKYGIPLRAHGYSVHLSKKNNFDLTEECKNYIDGLLMGDGSIRYTSKWSSMFRQSFALRYKQWTDKIVNDFDNFGVKSVYEEILVKERIIKGKLIKPSKALKLRSLAYEEFNYFLNKWYDENNKMIPDNIKITPQFLANWYLGDGSYNKQFKRILLFTNGFQVNDVKNFIIKLNKTHGFKSKISFRGNQPIIAIYRQKETEKFLKITRPYKVSCFNYKWGL